MSDIPHFIALGACILIVPVAQILLKSGVLARETSQPRMRLFTWCGFALLLGSTLLTAFALQVVAVKTFTAWSSLIYALVALLSSLLLKERLTPRRRLGCLLVVSGIFLFQFGSS